VKRQKNSIAFLTLILIITVTPLSVTTGKTIYVDSNAAVSANDGTSWSDAYVFLQDALADADESKKPVEIRVAGGIYTPDMGAGQTPGDRFAGFALINSVTIAGGYAGAIDPNARDIELYETILSGDLATNDTCPNDISQMLFETSRAENAYNVVTAGYTDQSAVLDGFTIASGNADDDYFNFEPQCTGGGLYIYQGEPLIANCAFTLNAGYEGGGMYNQNSNPTIINCSFDTNSAAGDLAGYGGSGGAIVNYQSNPNLANCTFTENYSNSGGGMFNFNNSNPVLTDCSFIRNNAQMKKGGGINNNKSNPVLTNCTFEANTAVSGGAMYSYDSMPIMTGCDFSRNTAINQGGGLCNAESEPNLTGCTFSDNSANDEGGGIYNDSCTNSVITGCTFIGNSAYSGGGLYGYYQTNAVLSGCTFIGNTAQEEGGAMNNWSCDLTISNCIFSGNSATYNCVGLLNIANNLTVTNCTFAGNTSVRPGHITDFFLANMFPPGYIEFVNCIIRDGENTIWNDNNSTIVVSYSNVAGGWEGRGNIDVDPLFADPNSGDYHLKSQAGRWTSTSSVESDPNSESWVLDEVTSPCIDAGDPNSPVAFEPQPNGGRINMGAFGGTNQASMIPTDEVNVDEDDNGTQVTLEQGQILVVTLESNPSTGYSWAVVENQDYILEQVGESEFVQPEQSDPPMVGAGGWEVFRLKAISPGQETLELVYRRAWETDAEPANTFSIDVVVN